MIKEYKSMEEIHKIVENLHNKRVNLDSDEVIKEMKDGAEKVKKEYNVKLSKQNFLAKHKSSKMVTN
ncbi:MAG: hypothetical protein MRK02_15715 [Candidatus Scalindua sp.]|nr:hypothetical protein [Candidatus Scalindua sp.]